jgi:hypothetical protein
MLPSHLLEALPALLNEWYPMPNTEGETSNDTQQ